MRSRIVEGSFGPNCGSGAYTKKQKTGVLEIEDFRS